MSNSNSLQSMFAGAVACFSYEGNRSICKEMVNPTMRNFMRTYPGMSFVTANGILCLGLLHTNFWTEKPIRSFNPISLLVTGTVAGLATDLCITMYREDKFKTIFGYARKYPGYSFAAVNSTICVFLLLKNYKK